MKKVLLLSSLFALGAAASYGTQLCSSLSTPNTVNVTDLTGFSCEIGDKIFSNFSVSGATAGDTVSFAGGGSVYTLHYDTGSAPITGAFTFGFTVSVDLVTNPQNVISQIQDQMFTQVVGGGTQIPNNSTASVTHTPGGSLTLDALNAGDQTKIININSASDAIAFSYNPNGNPGNGGNGQLSSAVFGISQTVVPEPVSLSLTGLGLLGLGFFGRRRAKQ